MAKVNRTVPISRRDVLKSRRRIHWRRNKGGELYASAWPPLRGKKKTPLQQQWVDEFKFLASAPKLADACALDSATELAKDTGYFWRDVISSALSGKLLHYIGAEENNAPLPMLYAQQVNKHYEGAPRVTTPSARVHMSASQACTQNVATTLIPDVKDWDNNVFWSATVHPERLTAKASGLYLILASMLMTPNAESGLAIRIMLNGSTVVARTDVATRTAATQQPEYGLIGLYYLNAGDYLTFDANYSSSGCTGQLRHFSVVGITPEAII